MVSRLNEWNSDITRQNDKRVPPSKQPKVNATPLKSTELPVDQSKRSEESLKYVSDEEFKKARINPGFQARPGKLSPEQQAITDAAIKQGRDELRASGGDQAAIIAATDGSFDEPLEEPTEPGPTNPEPVIDGPAPEPEPEEGPKRFEDNETYRRNQALIDNPELAAGAKIDPTMQTMSDAEKMTFNDIGGTPPDLQGFVPFNQRVPGKVYAAVMPPDGVDPQTGKWLDPTKNVPSIEASTASTPEAVEAAKVDASLIGDDVPQATAAQGEVSKQAQMTAAQTDDVGTQAAVSSIESVNKVAAAQVNDKVIIDAARATLSNAATATAAHAQASLEFKAATAEAQKKIDDSVVDPRATVQEQYKQLMDFGPNETPPWAAGAMRKATQAMAARGIVGSTMAGEAITMALMQSALPIAQQDAQVFQRMGELKLNQTAQIGILKASHLANLDVKNAEFQQQTSLQNASAALQIDMSNLSNEQQSAVVNAQMEMTRLAQNADRTQQVDLANVANMLAMETSNLDAKTKTAITNAQNMLQVKVSNLNARQQAASQNAKSFFDMDMANMSNEQQMAIVNNQSRLQAMMSDQASENAAKQFNAKSENQTNQFFASLASDTSKFNAAQTQDAAKFSANLNEMRTQFNEKNRMIVDQSNVVYLRGINTANTAATNQAQQLNAQNLLSISNTAMANEITMMRDKNSFIFQASENAIERGLRRALAEMEMEANLRIADKAAIAGAIGAIGGIFGEVGVAWAKTKFDGNPDTQSLTNQ